VARASGLGDRDAQSRTAALDWAVRYAVPLLGVVGAALYGVLRLAYVFFYLQVRATPEEVGYGYVQVLASQLIGAIELVFLVAVVLFAVGFAVGRLPTTLLRWLRHGGSRPGRALASGRTPVARLTLRAGAGAVAVVLVGLPLLAWDEGAEAAHGYAVRNVYLLHTIRLPVLAVQAVPAVVTWTPDSVAGSIDVGSRRCLLYLGRADGITVFFDVQSQESLRIPSDRIVVALQYTTGVPDECF
jgi:hypothetical protein